MEVEGGGQRCCREKEWSTGYPPPSPFKKFLGLREFCVPVPDGLLAWQDWAHCGLMTGTSFYGKSKGELPFCARTTESSLARSTCGRRRLASWLQHFPHSASRAANRRRRRYHNSALPFAVLFFFSAWNSRCASVCPIVTSPLSHRAALQAHLPTEGHNPDPLFTRREYSYCWLISFVILFPNTFIKRIQKAALTHSALEILPGSASRLQNHEETTGQF